jgi:hypothetical protein
MVHSLGVFSQTSFEVQLPVFPFRSALERRGTC